jgi:hypothetical protein
LLRYKTEIQLRGTRLPIAARRWLDRGDGRNQTRGLGDNLLGLRYCVGNLPLRQWRRRRVARSRLAHATTSSDRPESMMPNVSGTPPSKNK